MKKTETSLDTLETKYIGVSFLEIQRKHNGCKLQYTDREKRHFKLEIKNVDSTTTCHFEENICVEALTVLF